MKKFLIYFTIFALSILFTIFTNDNITNNSELAMQILFTLLGLCITSYTFICTPISNVVSKNKNLKASAINLLNKLEEDMKTIFLISLFIIAISVMKNIDFPFIKNPIELDFGLFVIKSLKTFIFNTILSFCFLLGLSGFYDFTLATFKITKGLLFVEKNN